MVSPKGSHISFSGVPVDSSQALLGSFLRKNVLACDRYKYYSSNQDISLYLGDDSLMYGAGNQSNIMMVNSGSSDITVTYHTSYRRFLAIDCLMADNGVLIDGVPFAVGLVGNDDANTCVITLPVGAMAIVRFRCLLDVSGLTDATAKFVPYV